MAAGLIPEKPVNKNYANQTASEKPLIKQHLQQFYKTFKQRSILFPITFFYLASNT